MTTTQQSAPTKEHLTIGRLVESLRDRHPDLSISKVRYLEEEGLLSPERTSGGYRKFSARDVHRLEIIMRLQEEHFLPLAVIKKKLAEFDSGKMPPELAGDAGDLLRISAGNQHAIDADEVSSVTGVSSEAIKELESFGLVNPKLTAQGKVYDSMDAEVLKIFRGLAAYGIEPRHLRMYGTFAQRESTFFSQIVLPAMRQAGNDPKERKKAIEALKELSSGTQQLHSMLLKRAMRDDFGEEAP